MKVATTDQLKEMISYAQRHDLNRQPAADMADLLDPTGLHVVKPVMIHEHANGAQVDPHVRCHVMAKLTGSDKPAEFYLDTDDNLLLECIDAEAARHLVRTLKARG